MQLTARRNRRSTMWLVFLGVMLVSSAALAASAIAVDQKSHAWGASWGDADVDRAAGHAIQRCVSSGGQECAVAISCSKVGFGAVYSREVGGHQQLGFSCGAATDLEATDVARYNCEVRVAITLKGLPKSVESAKMDWAFVLRRLAAVCPGLGNCRCGNRLAFWNG